MLKFNRKLMNQVNEYKAEIENLKAQLKSKAKPKPNLAVKVNQKEPITASSQESIPSLHTPIGGMTSPDNSHRSQRRESIKLNSPSTRGGTGQKTVLKDKSLRSISEMSKEPSSPTKDNRSASPKKESGSDSPMRGGVSNSPRRSSIKPQEVIQSMRNITQERRKSSFSNMLPGGMDKIKGLISTLSPQQKEKLGKVF